MPETRYAGPTRQEQRKQQRRRIARRHRCVMFLRRGEMPSPRIMSCDAGCVYVEAASPQQCRKTSIGAGPAISLALQVASDLVIALTAALKV
jgi:hypothetical protein